MSAAGNIINAQQWGLHKGLEENYDSKGQNPERIKEWDDSNREETIESPKDKRRRTNERRDKENFPSVRIPTTGRDQC